MWSERTLSRKMLGLGLMLMLTAAFLASATVLFAGDEPMTKEAMAMEAMADKAKPEEKIAEDMYPLETCVVSGGKLGSMGDPVVYVYEGREVRFCCKGCVSSFEKDPKTYLKKLDEAIVARDLPGYPLEVCVVTGKPLTGKDVMPIDHVYHDQLIRLYDDKAVKTFTKEPEMYLAKLNEARKIKAAQAAEMEAAKGAVKEDKGHSSCGGH